MGAHYQKVGAIRRNNSVYRDGAYRLLRLDRDALIFSRESGKKIFLTVVNRGEKSLVLRFSKAGTALLSGARKTSFTLAREKAEIIRLPADACMQVLAPR